MCRRDERVLVVGERIAVYHKTHAGFLREVGNGMRHDFAVRIERERKRRPVRHRHRRCKRGADGIEAERCGIFHRNDSIRNVVPERFRMVEDNRSDAFYRHIDALSHKPVERDRARERAVVRIGRIQNQTALAASGHEELSVDRASFPRPVGHRLHGDRPAGADKIYAASIYAGVGRRF